MKKQFFRVKQLADQTFLRAGKSEVLNQEELQVADQKFEYLRSALTAISKKIGSNGQTIDHDKRKKKCFEYQLGTILLEESQRGDKEECQLFQYTLKEAGRVEQELAHEYADHEVKVEQMVCAPLQQVLDNEIPNISKQKRNLSKYCLDKDSASNRYHATKKEALKDDMEEADIKVEQNRDALAAEMFGVVARENEFSTYLLQLLKLQRGYHESALNNLQTVIPELEKRIGDSPVKRVFGTPLQEHLRVTGKRIAYPLEVCITTLAEYGMSEEGLFRIGGGTSKVKRMKASLDSGCFSTLIPEYRDVHVIASTLKLYLRELPEPLLTYRLHKDWMQSMLAPEHQRLEIVRGILKRLPQENHDNLAYLLQFLAKLTQHPENKMSSSNIAIVMAPNLLWNQNEAANVNMSNCATVNMLVELFVKEVDTLFPEDVSKYVTVSGILPEEDRLINNSSVGDNSASTETINILDSPRPNLRKKKPAAPVPPHNVNSRTDQDIVQEKTASTSYYPSGSSTLNRPQRPRDPAKVKTTVGVNTDENSLSLSRKKSFKDSDEVHTKSVEPKVENLVNVEVPTSVPEATKAVVVEDNDKSFKTVVTHQIGAVETQMACSRPVAAPRSNICDDKVANVSRNHSLRNEVMSKSLSAVEGEVQLRKPEVFSKPEIPARPASLQKRSSIDEPAVQRTQCSYFNVANKQQPSIVNLNRNERVQPGHDSQMAEKERFLLHQPQNVVPQPRLSLENKLGDVNSNPQMRKPPHLPPKSLNFRTKSTEKLDDVLSNRSNDVNEQLNGNQNPRAHTRTRSDGNFVEVDGGAGVGVQATICQTPPSPRSLNKPTQPPPPPPVLSPKRSDGDNNSTDL